MNDKPTIETLGNLPVDFLADQLGLEGGPDLRKAMIELRYKDRGAWNRLVLAIASRTIGARKLLTEACKRYGGLIDPIGDKLDI